MEGSAEFTTSFLRLWKPSIVRIPTKPERSKEMPKIRLYALLALIFCVFTTAILRSQQQPKQPDSTSNDQGGFKIGVEVNMVTVPITVRKQVGGFIKGLPQSAFHIYEDGKPQEIVDFIQEGLPVRIALVLDNSGSVRAEWGTIKFSTSRFIENLKPDDRFAIVSFNTEIRLKMDWTRKTDRLDAVLSSIYCKDNTKLWDAIYVVSTDVFKNVKEKKAMIIMSDGLDNDSAVSYKDAVQAAVRSEAAVYVVSKTEAVKTLMETEYQNVPQKMFADADLALRGLAYETGGRVLYPNSFGQLDNVYAQVDEELRNQYTVGYLSTNAVKDGSYRHIDVRVEAQGAAVSARPGYYAPDELKSHPKM
jgi:VWFA-related protein